MDWNYLNTNGFALLIVLLLILGVIYLLTTPWHKSWHCPQCGQEFYSEEAADGHMANHMKHRPVEDERR